MIQALCDVNASMLATDFIAKWRAADLTERAAAQSHFRDLCELVGEDPCILPIPKGEWRAFQKAPTERRASTAPQGSQRLPVCIGA